jgi:hypothetical protein
MYFLVRCSLLAFAMLARRPYKFGDPFHSSTLSDTVKTVLSGTEEAVEAKFYGKNCQLNTQVE